MRFLAKQFTRRSTVIAICIVSLSLARPTHAKLNVLLFIADDMAHADLSCAGHPLLKTPNLDRIAATGVRFTHAFTPNPICTPSRAALLTGQDCFTNDCYFFGRPIKEDSPHFAQQIAAAGYDTFYTGKWHNMKKPWQVGFTSGATIIPGGCPVSRGGHEHPVYWNFGSPKKNQVTKFATTLVSDSAIEFLDSRNSTSAPFLMVVSYASPHDPWTPPGKYREMYPPNAIQLPPNFLPKPAFNWFTEWHGTQLRDEALMSYPRTADSVRDVRSRYFGMISQMDSEIGRVLDKVQSLDLTDQTAIIFVADHGISLGAHGFSGKQTMYEEGVRLPLLLSHPKINDRGRTNAELVSLVDLFPTLCAITEANVPKSVEGHNLLPLCNGDGTWPRQEIYAAFHSPEKHRMVSRMVRSKTHKLIKNFTTNEAELYDLESDPFEKVNLAGQQSSKTIQTRLNSLLKDWRTKYEPKDLAW